MTLVSPLPLPLMEDSIMKSLNWTDDMYDLISDEPSNLGNGAVPCSDAFHSIGGHYKRAHGYIALLVCLFGTVANSLNLLILTQKEMRTPINLILRALALVDVLVMVEYIPFAIHMYILHPTHAQSQEYAPEHFSYAWALFVLFHSHFTQILHTISIQLTLTMAVWRYVAIRFTSHIRLNAFCTFRRCYMAIAASFICPIFICIPNYLTFTIVYHHSFAFIPSPPYYFHGMPKVAKDLETLVNFCRILNPRDSSLCVKSIVERKDYVVDLSDLAKANGGILHIIHFWTFSVVVKLLPCVVLTFFMVYLVHTLYAAKQRQKVLQHSSGIPLSPVKAQGQGSRDNQKSPLVTKSPTCNGSGTNLPTPLVVFHGSSKSCLMLAVEEDPASCHVKKKKEMSTVHAGTGRKLLGIRKSTSPSDEHAKKCSRRSDRTSRMLVAVLVLFLITEFPQGIMAFLSGLYGADFFRKCYNTFAEIWDILALINSAVNFILYCFMSRQFRVQFRKFFPITNCFSTQMSKRVPKIHGASGNGNPKNTINTTVV